MHPRLVHSWFVRTAILCLAIAAAAVPVRAQEHRASIRGVVTDPAAAGVPDVEVRATREETSDTRRVRTDDRGRFSVLELPPGIYRLDVQLTGYGPFVARVELAMNQELRIDVALRVGSVVQAVEVTAPFSPVDHDSPALHTFVDARQLASLPLDGRNFLELALLAPGAAPEPQGSASSSRGDFALTINGAREDFNGFLLDGVYNVDPKLNTPSVRPPVDGIREFQVLTSTYDASFGRNAGGQINVITKSGANRFSGSGYEFFRGGGLAARNYFAPADEPAPDPTRHQFGGTIGGPIVRDSTFFFADYERTHLREGVTRITNVPTAAERIGDFSHSLLRAPVDPFTRQPFPGGVIPSFYQSPVGRAIAALYPLPNRATPSADHVSSPIRRDDIDQLDGRVDQSLASGALLTARYSFSDRRLFEPFAGPGFALVPGFGTDVPRRGQNVSVSFTHVPRRSLVNDVHFGYNRVAIGVFAENTALGNSSVGLPALSSNVRDAGLSVISIAGFSPLGHEYTTPQASTSDTFQVGDTATWSHGAHFVKAGGEWYGVRQAAYRDVQSRGFLTFLDQGYTGNALADLLLGLPVLTGGARLDNPQDLRTHSWSLFAQDDWRVRNRLTISAGVRYDFASPPSDAHDRANVYDVSTGTLVGLGTAGVPRGGYSADRNNLSPRAGFAWTLDAEQRNVLRAGYGIYYNQGALATSEGLYFNPPYFNLGVFFPAEGLPPLTLADPFPASFPVFIPPSATAYQRDLKTPWMEHWNLNVQHQIGDTRSVEVAYVGSRGHDLISARDVNQAPASASPLNLRPNQGFADITLIESRASSRYNALQVRYQQRPSRGTSLLMSYTLGKSTDDASGFFTSAGDANFPQNSLDPGAERGRSSFDVRHRFTASVLRPLPIGTGQALLGHHGWVSAALANLEIEGVVTIQTGRPFTVALLPDIDNSNTGRSNLGFGYNDRPNVAGDTSVNDATADQWFNTAAFSLPPFGTFGNSARNTVEGPGFQNVNLALVKRIFFGVRGRLELRAEAFNLLDRVNYDLPDAFFGSPTFGRILSAQSPRRVQLGIRAGF
jgi:hypothetical protein